MNMAGLKELKERLQFLVLALLVYRLGTHITVPGLDPEALRALFDDQRGILGLVNLFSGGALSRLSVFAIGIMPYISASIIVQIFSIISPRLERLRKSGEQGRRELSRYTRYLTVLLATTQGLGMSRMLVSSGVSVHPSIEFYGITTLTLVAGTMFLMWLGEKITERGVGNGISMLIFASIVSGLPQAIFGTAEQVRQGLLQPFVLVALVVLLFAVMSFVVFMERGQRRIAVHYARKQMVGRSMMSAQQTHLPLKINMSGVLPLILASTLVVFPATLARWLGNSNLNMDWLSEVGFALSPGQPLYVVLLAVGIVFFCFFYTALTFNAKETAENLKRAGAFVPGIRPGEHTASYIDKVMTRLTLVGAMYITLVALLPEFLILGWQVPFYFGGTSLLIVVVVIMDFMSQVQAHLISRQYDGMMKKGMTQSRSAGSHLKRVK